MGNGLYHVVQRCGVSVLYEILAYGLDMAVNRALLSVYCREAEFLTFACRSNRLFVGDVQCATHTLTNKMKEKPV